MSEVQGYGIVRDTRVFSIRDTRVLVSGIRGYLVSGVYGVLVSGVHGISVRGIRAFSVRGTRVFSVRGIRVFSVRGIELFSVWGINRALIPLYLPNPKPLRRFCPACSDPELADECLICNEDTNVSFSGVWRCGRGMAVGYLFNPTLKKQFWK